MTNFLSLYQQDVLRTTSLTGNLTIAATVASVPLNSTNDLFVGSNILISDGSEFAYFEVTAVTNTDVDLTKISGSTDGLVIDSGAPVQIVGASGTGGGGGGSLTVDGLTPIDTINFTNATTVSGGAGIANVTVEGDGQLFATATDPGRDFLINKLVGGDFINIVDFTSSLTIDANLNFVNLGLGEGVFSSLVGGTDTINLKSLVAGAGINLSSTTDEITIESTSVLTNIGSGISLLGSGAGEVKSVTASGNLTITSNVDTTDFDVWDSVGYGDIVAIAKNGEIAIHGAASIANYLDGALLVQSFEDGSLIPELGVDLVSVDTEAPNTVPAFGGLTISPNVEEFLGSKSLDTSVSYDFLSDFTLSLWFRTTSSGSNQRILSQSDGTDNFAINISSSGNLQIARGNGTSLSTKTVGAVATNTWYFVTIVYRSATAEWLAALDTSTLTNEGTFAATSNTGSTIHLGSDTDQGSGFFGFLAQVNLWNRELAESEIAEVYNTGSGLLIQKSDNKGRVFIDINALDEETSPVSSTDFAVIYDASSDSNKKVLLSNLGTGGGGGSGNVTGYGDVITLSNSQETAIHSSSTIDPKLVGVRLVTNFEQTTIPEIGEDLTFDAGSADNQAISGTSAPSNLSRQEVFNGSKGLDWELIPFTNNSTEFTATAWFKTNSNSTRQMIFNNFDGTDGWLLFILEDGSLRAGMGNGVSISSNTLLGSVATDTWYFVAMAVTSTGTMRYSLNGAAWSTSNFSGITSDQQTTPIQIGHRVGGNRLDGAVAQAIYYQDTVLESADIATLYNSGNGVLLTKDLNVPSSGGGSSDTVNEEVLTGNKVLVSGDDVFQALDPNGANRNVTLPSSPSTNDKFVIVNDSDGTNSLTILDGASPVQVLSAATTIFSRSLIYTGTKWLVYA